MSDKMYVDYYSEEGAFEWSPALSGREEWLAKVCGVHGLTLNELTVVLCSDEELLEVNQTHLNHDYYTDIITFDSSFNREVSGELYISLDRIRDNARSVGVSSQEEFDRVLVHGVLHLCGFGDKTEQEQKEMGTREDDALDMIKKFHVEH